MRDGYGIVGNGCSDCFASWCCPCCALVQEDKEVEVEKKEKEERLRREQQVYTSQPEMNYAPQ